MGARGNGVARATFVRRHRATIASGVALTVAAGAVVAYAVSASGYKKHEAELNDGGIWVVNGKLGWSGRLNKPINQLDGVVPGEDGKARLDVVQDGAAVVILNIDSSRGQAIETSQLESQDGGAAAIPTAADVRMAGGTLATADTETGELWAVRYDAGLGKPVMTSVDRQAKPLVEAGESAAMTVSQDGTVVLTSAAEGTLTTIGCPGHRLRQAQDPGPPGRRRPGLLGHRGRRAHHHSRRGRRRAERRRRRHRLGPGRQRPATGRSRL